MKRGSGARAARRGEARHVALDPADRRRADAPLHRGRASRSPSRCARAARSSWSPQARSGSGRGGSGSRSGRGSIPGKQAAAAVGQIDLCRRFERAFAREDLLVGQILLDHAGFVDRERFLNARRTLAQLLADRVVPLINENDSVATEELRFGDNDQLAAQVGEHLRRGSPDPAHRRRRPARRRPRARGRATLRLPGVRR